ncbi:MAG TPA: VTT domain-containing protein [Terriglobales bacterium]|nr:VTT domain-containing protein [Terriglobales bacterium]
MHWLKHFLSRYTAWVWGVLKPLGAWGVFGIAFVDAAFMGIPMDPVVAGYVYSDQAHFWMYILMASAGSALGSLPLYVIGYKGGELLLAKRISKDRMEKMRDRFEKQEFFALMIPSMLPPPTPFKLFVLSAGVFEMHVTAFLGAIFLGRVLRFGILSALVLAFGPHVVSLVGRMAREHLPVTIAIGVAAIVLIYVLYRLLRAPVVEMEHELEQAEK